MAQLAAAASIIQIADVGFRLGVKLFAFAETVANADKAIIFTSKDVSLTSSVLKEVGEVLKKDQAFRTYSSEAIQTAAAVVEECSEVFKEMEQILVEKVPNIHSEHGGRLSRVTTTLERFKWSYWQPRLQLLRSNLDILRSTLLVMLNVITYQRLISTEPTPALPDRAALIRDLIDAREKYVRKYEELKRSITPAKDSIAKSPNASDESSVCSNAHASRTAIGTPSQSGDDYNGDPSLADLNQEQETTFKFLGHLLSLFDRLIAEVDTPTYQIGLLSRYRIRSQIYRARSNEIDQMQYLYGQTTVDGALKPSSIRASYDIRKESSAHVADPEKHPIDPLEGGIVHVQENLTSKNICAATQAHANMATSTPPTLNQAHAIKAPSMHPLSMKQGSPSKDTQQILEDLLALWTPLPVDREQRQ